MSKRALRIAFSCMFLLLATSAFAIDRSQAVAGAAGPQMVKASATQAAKVTVAAPAFHAQPNIDQNNTIVPLGNTTIPTLSSISLGALAVAFAAVGAGVLRKLQ